MVTTAHLCLSLSLSLFRFWENRQTLSAYLVALEPNVEVIEVFPGARAGDGEKSRE